MLQVIIPDGGGKQTNNDKHMTAFKLMDGKFSPDEKYVIGHSKNGLTFCFLVERGKFLYKWGEVDPFRGSFGEQGKPVAFTILPKNYLVQAGLSYDTRNFLFVRNLNSGDTIRDLQCGGYAVDVFLLNRSNNVAAACNSDTGYSSSSGSTKDVFVWDLEKGNLIANCEKRSPTNAVAFLGANDEYLLVCSWRSSAVDIWYVGTPKQPSVDGVQIRHLIGHSDDVISLNVSMETNTLVTTSKDNTIKLWSLDRIESRCDDVMTSAGEKRGNLAALRQSLMTKRDDIPCQPSEEPVKSTALVVAS